MKYRRIGTFAIDCGKPASKDNLYYVNRVLWGASVQRDQMCGPSTRDSITVLNAASETRPNEISLRGKREAEPIEMVWVIEKDHQLGVEVAVGGKKYISGGKVVANGQDTPWVNRCGG